MLRFLLDTNVLSEPLRSRPTPSVLEKLKQHEREICTTSIVWHELRYGAMRLADGRLVVAPYMAHLRPPEWWENQLRTLRERGII